MISDRGQKKKIKENFDLGCHVYVKEAVENSRTKWGNGNRTKEIELMELGLTCSKFLKRSCEIELISYFLKQELELICYRNWN